MKKTSLTLILGGILLAGSAVAHEAGSVVLRDGAITVDANSSSPSLYAQYYFFKADSVVRPYLGAGLNYTRFYHAKSVHPAVTNLEVKKHSFGPVANVGIDVKLTQNVYFNVSAWYTHIKTTAKFQALGANHEVKLKLDPMVYFAGIAVKF